MNYKIKYRKYKIANILGEKFEDEEFDFIKHFVWKLTLLRKYKSNHKKFSDNDILWCGTNLDDFKDVYFSVDNNNNVILSRQYIINYFINLGYENKMSAIYDIMKDILECHFNMKINTIRYEQTHGTYQNLNRNYYELVHIDNLKLETI